MTSAIILKILSFLGIFTVVEQRWVPNCFFATHKHSLQRWFISPTIAMSMRTTLTSNSYHSKYIWFISQPTHLDFITLKFEGLETFRKIYSLSWPISLDYGLASHTTYVVCVNFIHEWQDLQFKFITMRHKQKKGESSKQRKHTTF